jgi:hypothetical protein
VSRRLRPVADDWQQVPKEWLNGSSSRSKATDGDDDSELSDLTDEETHEAIVQATFGSPVKVSTFSASCSANQQDEPMVKSDSPLSEASAPKSDPVVDEPEPEPVVEEAKDEPMDEDKDEEDEAASEEEPEVEEEEEEPEPDEFEEGLKHAKDLPEGFIEWETVSVFYATGG